MTKSDANAVYTHDDRLEDPVEMLQCSYSVFCRLDMDPR